MQRRNSRTKKCDLLLESLRWRDVGEWLDWGWKSDGKVAGSARAVVFEVKEGSVVWRVVAWLEIEVEVLEKCRCESQLEGSGVAEHRCFCLIRGIGGLRMGGWTWRMRVYQCMWLERKEGRGERGGWESLDRVFVFLSFFSLFFSLCFLSSLSLLHWIFFLLVFFSVLFFSLSLFFFQISDKIKKEKIIRWAWWIWALILGEAEFFSYDTNLTQDGRKLGFVVEKWKRS